MSKIKSSKLYCIGYSKNNVTTAGFNSVAIDYAYGGISLNIVNNSVISASYSSGTKFTVIPDSITSIYNSLFLNGTCIDWKLYKINTFLKAYAFNE